MYADQRRPLARSDRDEDSPRVDLEGCELEPDTIKGTPRCRCPGGPGGGPLARALANAGATLIPSDCCLYGLTLHDYRLLAAGRCVLALAERIEGADTRGPVEGTKAGGAGMK